MQFLNEQKLFVALIGRGWRHILSIFSDRVAAGYSSRNINSVLFSNFVISKLQHIIFTFYKDTSGIGGNLMRPL